VLAARVPEIHHTDQGMKYACSNYTDLLREHGVQINMAAVGKPEANGYANGYAKRLMWTIKEEEVGLSEYEMQPVLQWRFGQVMTLRVK